MLHAVAAALQPLVARAGFAMSRPYAESELRSVTHMAQNSQMQDLGESGGGIRQESVVERWARGVQLMQEHGEWGPDKPRAQFPKSPLDASLRELAGEMRLFNWK